MFGTEEEESEVAIEEICDPPILEKTDRFLKHALRCSTKSVCGFRASECACVAKRISRDVYVVFSESGGPFAFVADVVGLVDVVVEEVGSRWSMKRS